MKCDGTSNDDVPINISQNIDLISSLRKDNLALQVQIGHLQSQLQKRYYINEQYRQENEKIKELNNEIDDLKLRLNISMNNFKDLQRQNSKEKTNENQVHILELSSLTNQIKEVKQENLSLNNENKQLKLEIETLIHKEQASHTYSNSQYKMLLASAGSYFKTEFVSIEQLQTYLLNSTMPPLINPKQEKTIESQQKLIKSLKKMLKKLKTEMEITIENHQKDKDQLNQKIQHQSAIINDLNLQIQSQKDKFYKKIIKLKREIVKPSKLYKYTCPTISIFPEIPKQDNQSKLVETLNSTIDQIQNEKLNLENELKNKTNELNKIQSENSTMKAEISNHKSKLKTIKSEYELKLKLANSMITDLTKDLPDPVAEKLIIAAKSKLRQQKETIMAKDMEIEKLEKEIDELNIKISDQKVEIIRLKAQASKPNESEIQNNDFEFDCESEPISHQPADVIFFNYSGISAKIKSIVGPIIDNTSFDAASKLQICIQRLNNFFITKKNKMSKLKKIIENCNISIGDIFQLLLNRHVDLKMLSENPGISAEAIAKLKEITKQIDSFEDNIINQNKEIDVLNSKLKKTKYKLSHYLVEHKTIKLCQDDIDEIKRELVNLVNEKDRLENECQFLRCHNNELLAECQSQKKIIDQMKYYKELFIGMKKKCDYQRKTLKRLGKYDC